VTRDLIVVERKSGCRFDCRACWRAPNSTGLVDSFFPAIAVDVHFENRGMMDEAIDGREGHGLIREDFSHSPNG
jgi:hypothetical protein